MKLSIKSQDRRVDGFLHREPFSQEVSPSLCLQQGVLSGRELYLHHQHSPGLNSTKPAGRQMTVPQRQHRWLL
ncbi:hypothetical protein PBY51_014529 [Eleginops maclovinus]|uniref:Uncharacterized protein n=1 Tax=Eleginops maclovinus TaxID=56733 RepID=A0AAN7WX16_ELEMC|nr:hypothetical protein PBY51_014529 [Eleginops maclovinus]